MKKNCLPLLFIFFSLIQLPLSLAQRGKTEAVKDTIIYYFCSSFPEDLDALATYQAAQENLKKVFQKESKRYVWDARQLTDEKFNLVELRNVVSELRLRGKYTRVIFHFFDHGQNTGGKLPTLLSRFVPSSDGKPGPGLIDVEKNVIDPLLNSKLGFFLVFVDACNEVLPEGATIINPGNANIPSQGLSVEEMMKKLEPSKEAQRIAIGTTKIPKELNNEPLGLILGFDGWMAVSSVSPDQKAVVPRNTGGDGSLFFLDLLVNNGVVNKNWIKFLDAYRQVMETNSTKRRKQTPVWMGVINGKPMAEEELLNQMRVLPQDEAEAMIQEQHGKISLEMMKDYATGTVVNFCNYMNNTHDGNSLPKALEEICISPIEKVTVYDDLSVPMNRSANTKYVTLQQYRSRRGAFKSLYIEDSLKLDRLYEDTRRKGVVYIVFSTAKEITGPRNYQPTKVRQRIFLEVQQESDPNVWQKMGRLGRRVGRFFRIVKPEAEKSPVLVQKIWNIPEIRKPDTTVVIIPDTPIVEIDTIVEPQLPPITAEDFYQANAYNLMKALYAQIEAAANHNDQSARSKDDIVASAKALFNAPETDIFEVSSLSGTEKKLTPALYFDRFWKEFEGFKYDSVKYTTFEFVSKVPENNPEGGYLQKVDDDRWFVQVQYNQVFEGFRKKRRTYDDITTKNATIWVLRKPGAANSAEPFELRIGSVDVLSTRRVNKTKVKP